MENQRETTENHLIPSFEASENGIDDLDGHDYNSDKRDFQDIILEIASKIPKEELANIPPDFSENFDHYLYGVPKKSERE